MCGSWIRHREMIQTSDNDLEKKSELCRYEMGKVNEEEAKDTTLSKLGAEIIGYGQRSPY